MSFNPMSILSQLRLRLVVLLILVGTAGLYAADTKPFDLPAAAAEKTLRAFSTESGLSVVFPSDITLNVRTQALKGNFTPREALDRLLVGTGLVAVADARTGAFTIERRPAEQKKEAEAKPADAAPAADPTPARDDANLGSGELIALSPFVVQSDRDSGYTATNTLAGSRLNTELRDTAAAISVFTKQFLEDIAVTNVVDAMSYALNGGPDNSDYHGAVTSDRSDGLIQLRGFGRATLLRDYFPFSRSADIFNTERIDFARGPNSVLFGISSTGGVVSATTKQARFDRTFGQAQLRVGRWDDFRGTFDVNRPVTRTFAVRVNGVYQERESWRDFEFLKLKGGALGATWRPWKNTSVRVQSEYIDRQQIVAYPWGPVDIVGAWLDAGRPISANNTAAVAGTTASTNRYVIYDPTSALGPVSWFGTRITSPKATATPASTAQGPGLFRFDLVPRSVNLMGPGARGDNHYGNHSVFVEQRAGPFVGELSYNAHRSRRVGNNPVTTAENGVRADANALLPNGGPNPNVGRFYVESNASYTWIDERFDNLHLTGSLDLDLRAFHLGKHRLAMLASREKAETNYWFHYEVNTTPAGNSTYPANFINVNNRVYRRTYLDFTSGDPVLRGAHDPLAFPIRGVNSVTSGFRRVFVPSLTDIEVDAAMVATQSSFWNERLQVTAGLRRDKQTSDIPDAATWNRDPVTMEFISPAKWNETAYAGNTGTYGAVVHVHPLVGLFFNGANNFSPQTNIALDGAPVGPRTGRGRDFGAKLSLPGGRISATVTRYELRQKNLVGLSGPVLTAMQNVINDMWEAIDSARVLSTLGDTIDTDGRGWEFDVTANLTPRWRLACNLNHSSLVQSNTLPRVGAYLADNRSTWLASGSRVLPTPSVQVPADKRTVTGALETITSLYQNQAVANGREPYQFRRMGANLFTSYTLDKDTPAIGPLTLGLGLNYRSAPVAGYDATTFQPLFGGKTATLNVMLGRTFPLKQGRRVRVQLNVDNLLDNQDLLITDRDQSTLYRYVFQRPRSWSLSSTLSF
jgi:outer membrane receptor protein involved in Fe transport